MTDCSDVDIEMLTGLRDLLGDKFIELVDTYVNDSNRRLELLRTAVPAKDFNTINHEAHGLKGSSRNLGANPFAEICGQLEAKGKQEDDSGIDQLFVDIEQNLAAVCQKLKELV